MAFDGEAYMEALRELNPNLYTPNDDSLLMRKKKAQYAEYLENKPRMKVSVMESSAFIYLPQSLVSPDSHVCVYLFTCFAERYPGKTLLETSKIFGFDADCPPDTRYMLILLHQFAGNAEIFTHLPQKVNKKMSNTQNLAMYKMLVAQKVTKKENPIPTAFTAKIRSACNTYFFLKFKSEEYKTRLEEIKEQSKSDPAIRRIFNEFFPDAINKITNLKDDVMNIEGFT